MYMAKERGVNDIILGLRDGKVNNVIPLQLLRCIRQIIIFVIFFNNRYVSREYDAKKKPYNGCLSRVTLRFIKLELISCCLSFIPQLTPLLYFLFPPLSFADCFRTNFPRRSCYCCNNNFFSFQFCVGN